MGHAKCSGRAQACHQTHTCMPAASILPSHCLTNLAHVLRAAQQHDNACRFLKWHAARTRRRIPEPHGHACEQSRPQRIHGLLGAQRRRHVDGRRADAPRGRPRGEQLQAGAWGEDDSVAWGGEGLPRGRVTLGLQAHSPRRRRRRSCCERQREEGLAAAVGLDEARHAVAGREEGGGRPCCCCC